MAEKETQSKAAVYRSVSFKKLHNWKANKSGSGAEDQRHGSEDLETGGALPPPAAQPSDMRSAAVARKVSKISAASLSRAELKKGSTHTISPSIRQLSEKFGTNTNSGSTSVLQSAVSHRIRSPDGPSSQDISGCFPDQGKDLSGTLTDKLLDHKCQESVSGSDSDRGHKRRVRMIGGGTQAGKSDYSEISDGSDSFSGNTLNSEDDICVLGISTCKSHRHHRSSLGETIHVDSSWPSVTKIRELFGDGHRKKHKSMSDGEDLKSDDYHLHHSYSTKDGNTSSDKSDRQSPLQPRGHWQNTNSSDHDANRHQGMDSAFSTEKHSHDGDLSSVTRKLSTDRSRVETHKSSRKGWTDSDPRPTPPTPPPRSSSVALPLRSHSCAHSEQLQEQRQWAKQPQPSDSLHSSHSSSKPQTGSSVESVSTRERLSSGEEEDESGGQTGRKTLSFVHSSEGIGTHISRNKHDAWAKLSHRSSGSEEDSPAGLAHQVRRRSLRKKKKSNCSRENEESDDSDDQHVMMEHLERNQRSCDSQMEGHRLDSLRSKACCSGQMWERGHTARGSSVVQDSYRRLCKASEGQVGTSNVPFVSRVSKVTIPSFLSTPLGSRCSSRYSSTETLKAEDLVSSTSNRASSSVLSKTYHGNATMYRSPSFGHGDNFSRAPVRVRPWLVPSLKQGEGIRNAAENRLGRRSVSHEKDKDRISMSNPDIASETLSLLSYLKTDLSELRMKKRGQDGEEGLNSSLQGAQSVSNMYRMGSRTSGLNSRRPSLKDLTATLRRTKSFTYSEKPLGSAMRSSSEQRLDCESDGDRVVISDREVESDDCRGCYDYEEQMPTPLQDRYVQEARQVIRDICQMSANKDYDDDDIEGFKRNGTFDVVEANKETNMTKQVERMDGQIVDTVNKKQADIESGKCLPRGNSEENMFGDKSLDELSGHESSLTDEGIVTEPEAGSYGGLSSGTDLLGQTLTVWTQSGLYEEQSSNMTPEKSLSAPAPSVRTEYEAVAIGGDVSISKNVNQASLEAPPTPSALRRRRKFSTAANNGSDSSNGSNGESNGESAYRSLSDPMPHRSRSVAEDGSNSFSMDSNLLGSLSLNSKVGVSADSSAADLSECTGSAASDLSVYSDSLRDYSTVIQSIVHEPGAMDKLIDEKANGKAVKKKSFSDPSRRGELASPALEVRKHPNEPINELEQPIPPSSSEPILSEQRDELWELNSEQCQPYSNRRTRSQSEHVLPCHLDRNGVNKDGNEEPKLPFDPKLAQVLSPCISRRGYKKRTHRVTHQQSCDYGDQLDEQQEDQNFEDHLDPSNPSIPPQLSVPKIRPKHVRHASEPATFVPITPSNQPRSSSQHLSRHRQEEGTPSLEDVTEQYILALNSPEGSSEAPTDGAVVEGTSSAPATATTDPKLQRKCSDELTQAPLKTKPRVDMRRHVMMTLLDTEQSYVDSLRTLIQSYMKPLKQAENSPLCDPSLVDEMFYQIPEILEHHELFLEQVISCVNDWHERQTIGDLLVLSFSKEVLANIYSAYIDNFLNAKDAVRIAKEAKPAFMKFLEQSMRENKEKQALGDLMIKPVQRIPRYELLVKDLLKHTPEDHPDHPHLLDAQKNIKRLAERINKGRRNAEEVERETRVMQEIEAHIEGVEHILNPQRKFLRQEMVMEAKSVGGKKDRSLFLFSDLLICTTLKRKSGSLRRSSMSLYSAASVIDTSSKYKFLWKLPLEDIEVVKGSNQATNRDTIQKTISRLDEDLSTLGQISKLSETLSFPHQSLDDVIKDLMASVHRELAEKQSLAFSMTFLPTKLELSTASADSTFIFEFSSPDARSNFEQAFEEAKKKLAMNKDEWDPEFLKAIPIMKTRSGMQFSCASPSHSSPENVCEVWVCNSDGYVGQVCVLSIRAEPTVEACIAVCSARIICIAAVPGLKSRERVESRHSAPAAPSESLPAPSVQPQLHISISRSSPELSDPPAPTAPELGPFESDDSDDEDSPSPSSTLQSQASHSTISSSYGNDEGAGCKDMAPETTSSEEEQEFSSGFGPQRLSVDSPMDGRAMRRSSRGSFTRASLEDLLSIDPEAHQSSVWLGTEDGCIHVYQSSDNIRNRKNSMKMQHSASILCIQYLDNKVFVSLANGEVIVYQREAGSFWDPQSSQTLCLGSPSSPVTKMVPVAGKLWCGCQNRILIINTSTLTQEHSFAVGQDSGRCVTCMVSYGQGVWVALQGSAQVRLYHSTSYESIAEVDVAPAVHKMLAGSDAIIRQHKAACLRITALLACRDVLWIGTSAGVVLTLPVPPVTSTVGTVPLRAPLVPTGSAHGHTGHVRFLTSIELPEGFDVHFPSQTESELSTDGGVQQRRSSTLLTGKSTLLVISGGDGYEDFRLNSSSETVGRDDSTNHLLLWRV
ncbi:rho guanine nucleotide exchange factor 17 isoform X1 [Pangasianodon hypophthalmus]|uniref:rho guanine nucleotide exchange factor 17 isoform X1 n=1 Tax=Pangasianodon hypophthalmus TaxID=310915 RepID=UPI000EFDEF85|nr:rho guanine nucleotide exchange factor 17 isoform X1 [Pangasianodon hypophthalmus]